MNGFNSMTYSGDYLEHHGIKGQHWGERRFQDEQGRWTAAGRERYGKGGNPKSSGKVDYRSTKTKVLERTYAATATTAIAAGTVGTMGLITALAGDPILSIPMSAALLGGSYGVASFNSWLNGVIDQAKNADSKNRMNNPDHKAAVESLKKDDGLRKAAVLAWVGKDLDSYDMSSHELQKVADYAFDGEGSVADFESWYINKFSKNPDKWIKRVDPAVFGLEIRDPYDSSSVISESKNNGGFAAFKKLESDAAREKRHEETAQKYLYSEKASIISKNLYDAVKKNKVLDEDFLYDVFNDFTSGAYLREDANKIYKMVREAKSPYDEDRIREVQAKAYEKQEAVEKAMDPKMSKALYGLHETMYEGYHLGTDFTIDYYEVFNDVVDGKITEPAIIERIDREIQEAHVK